RSAESRSGGSALGDRSMAVSWLDSLLADTRPPVTAVAPRAAEAGVAARASGTIINYPALSSVILREVMMVGALILPGFRASFAFPFHQLVHTSLMHVLGGTGTRGQLGTNRW